MKRFILRSSIVVGVFGTLAGVAACQGADHGQDQGGDFQNPGGPGGTGGPCTDGQERACGIPVDSHDGIVDCIEATQVCTAGVWGECGEKGPVSTKSVKLVDPGLSTDPGASVKGLGSASTCTSNPCDPYCQQFPDTPPGTLDAGTEPDALAYTTDSAITLGTTSTGISIDGGAPADAALGSDPVGSGANYNGPCTNNSQCNLDQHCVGGTCTSWGSGEYDTTCSAPGDSFGAVQPQLLCNYVDSNDHYGEFQGSATVAQFNKKSGAVAAVVGIAGYSDYLANHSSKTGHNRLDGKIKIFDAKQCKTLLSIPSADDSTPKDVETAAVPVQQDLGETNVLRFNEQSTPLLVDLDGDGVPEIVAEGAYYYASNSYTLLRLFAFKINVDASGNYTASYYSKWKDAAGITGRAYFNFLNDDGGGCTKNSDCTSNSYLASLPTCDTANGYCSSYAALIPLGYWDSSGPSALDLDNDGTPEIIWNGYVFNASGQYIGYRPDPNGLGASNVDTMWGSNPIAGDFDLDGKVELMERQGLFEAGSFSYSGSNLSSMSWAADANFSFPTYKGCSSGYTLLTSGTTCAKCSRSYSTFNSSTQTCDGCPDSSYTQVSSGALANYCAKCSSGTLVAGSGLANDGKCAVCANSYQPYNSADGKCEGCNTASGYALVSSGALAGQCAKCSSGTLSVGGANDGRCTACTNSYQTYNAATATCDGCIDSTYTHTTSGTLAGKCAKCSSGTLVSGSGLTNDGKCEACSNSYQTYNVASGTCDGCNTAGGYAKVTSGALSGQCAKCSAGTLSVGGANDGHCTACANAYQAYNGATATCDGCDTSNGYSQVTSGTLANQCAKCASGTLVSGAGVPNDGKCEACAANETYNAATGACDCSAAAGYQKVTAGSLANKCVKCPSGYPYVGTQAATNGKCVSCGGGTWNPATSTCSSGTMTTASATASFTYSAVTLTTPGTAAYSSTNTIAATTAAYSATPTGSTPTTTAYSATPIAATTAAYSANPTLSTPTNQPYSLTGSTSPTGFSTSSVSTVTLPSSKPSASSHDPFIAFADFGAYGGSAATGKPEMVWVSEDYVWVMAVDGTPVMGFPSSYTSSNGLPNSSGTKTYKYQGTLPSGEVDSLVPMPPKGTSSAGGGSVTIGDYDNDGLPEFGIAGGSYYVVFDLDCISPRNYNGKTGVCDRSNAVCDCGTCGTATENNPILWCRGTQDQSSFITGSSVFDFNADGKAEVVYADECWLRVYDGATGTVYFSAAHSSQTKLEEPIVADVNADGRADLLMTSTRAGESTAGAGLSCPSTCSSSESLYNNACYSCGNATIQGSGPYTCSDGSTPTVRGLVTEDVYFNGTKQTGYAVDRNFPGLPCQTATDCPSTGMTCSAGLCRCTTATYSPTSDPQCGAGFTCVDPHTGTAGSGKVCRAIRCTGSGCGVSGVQVYTGPAQGWAKSRAIWNEQAYTPTNVNDDGSVKKTSTLTSDETAAWTPNAPRSNSFRQQLQKPGTAAIDTPSLTLEYPCDANSIPVCNRGSGQAAAGQVVVGFASTGTSFSGSTDRTIAVGPCTTTVPIDPGQCINLTCPGIGNGPLEYVVNPSCVGPVCTSNAQCSGSATCDPTSHHCLDNSCTNVWTPSTQCSPASGQWAYTAGSSPNPAYCGGGSTATAATFTRLFVANNCPTGTSVKWGLFSYATNDPLGTNVTFSFQTGATSTTLGAAVPIAVAGYTTGTSTVAKPQTCQVPADGSGSFTCPISIASALTGAGQRVDQPYLQMNAQLNPYVSGGVASVPVLTSWNVTYDCIPSE